MAACDGSGDVWLREVTRSEAKKKEGDKKKTGKNRKF